MEPYVERNKIYFSAPDADLNDEEVAMEAIFDCKAEPGPGEKEIQISVKITEVTDANTGEAVRCTEKIRSVIAEILKEFKVSQKVLGLEETYILMTQKK